MVINKPAGLLSQGEEKGDENLVDLLRVYLGRNYVGLVHRLDRNTSGLMVVAKRSKSAERLTEALKAGELKRGYLALVMGHLKAPELLWRHELLKDDKNNRVRVVHSGGKSAILKIYLIQKLQFKTEPLSLVRLELETGRSHQIRVQSAFEGHPLVGDFKYGQKLLPDIFKEFPRPALHSAELKFPHPMTKEILHFESALPDDMKSFAK